MTILSDYLNEIARIRATGAGTAKTSYYGAPRSLSATTSGRATKVAASATATRCTSPCRSLPHGPSCEEVHRGCDQPIGFEH
jgi:hypothetical protein